MKRLSAPLAALGLALVLPVHAMAGADQMAAPTRLAQNQTQQENLLRDRQKQQSTTQERARAQQEMRARERNIQRTDQIQSRDREQLERRLQDRTAPPMHQRYDWGQYRPGQPPADWRQHQRFDPRAWQRNFTATNRFRWHAYRRPPGWYYRHWVFGMVLPTFFWTPDYWITDYWVFGLMNPPYGYVWVRYGDDALLVNVQTGLILRVVYSLFY